MQEKTKQNFDGDEEQHSSLMNPLPYSSSAPAPPEIQAPPPVTHQPQMSFMYAGQSRGVGTPMNIGQMGVGTPTNVGQMGVGEPGTMTAAAPGFIMHNQMVPQSTPFHCKSCDQQIVTKVTRKATFKTHGVAAAACIACCIPCAIIPYFLDPCKQADHYCPNCDSFIGSYIP